MVKKIVKKINSCFGNKEFADYIKNETDLMMIGLQTNFCIDATVKSAFEKGYNVIVPLIFYSQIFIPSMRVFSRLILVQGIGMNEKYLEGRNVENLSHIGIIFKSSYYTI